VNLRHWQIMVSHMMKKISLFLAVLSWIGAAASSGVVPLNEDTWHQVTKGEWMIKFYAPWCPACSALKDAWDSFAEWTDDLSLDGVAEVDVTDNPGLSGRFLVMALPTIYHVKDGVFRVYRGARDKDSFISFIEDKTWTETEAVPIWRDPSSPQMALVAYFFKASMLLRSVHTTIVNDMGWPSWISYVVFALATILMGTLLGLVLVCCIDCIYPPKKHANTQEVQSSKSDGEESDINGEREEEEAEPELEEEPAKEVSVRKRRPKKVD